MKNSIRAALFLALLVIGCSNPLTKIQAASGPPRCAELVARAFASPNVAVVGAYACFSPTVQAEARGLTPPIVDDVSFGAYSATDPVLTAYSYKGSKFDAATKRLWYYFEFTPGPLCWRAHVDSAGHVDVGQWKHGSCLPLP